MRLRTATFSLATLLLAASLASCGLAQKMFRTGPDPEVRAGQLHELQLRVMRYADEYAGRIQEPISRFQQESMDAGERLAAQNWKLSQSTSAYTIASGPSPLTNALDMVVLATLSRMVLEDSWVGERYGNRAAGVLDAHRALEPRAWELLEGELTAEQEARLHEVIDDWRKRNPTVRAVAYVHFRDFAKSVGRPSPGESAQAGSLFSMLGLDPLSNLDPAVREIAQTRQLAERTIYYIQRAPNLLDMQVERLTYQFATMPETKDLISAVDRAGRAAEQAGAVAGGLPDVLSREREAAIAQFMDALNEQQAATRSLVGEMREALEAGTVTSQSLGETIRSFDALMARFDKPQAASQPPSVPAKPFDITEYTAAAREFAATTRELQSLVMTLDAQGAEVATLAARAGAEARGVTDHVFRRLAALLALLLVGLLAVALGYRAFTHWLAQRQ